MSDPHSKITERRPPSETVVRAVASALDTTPLDLRPPLYERVDPEALDSLVRSGSRDLRVRFRYQGRPVVVTGDGRVELPAATENDCSSEGATGCE
ncbi:hypothetical protein C488_13048 [Natrinema pellirubrum DSM 15624]|uniref:Halobacterial output domain-containing protein n=1 Tax=Natrinema pellirubrum (strain DSM 15624 / CIP 106293 / JCM 10476 / NCIMB 786 / 157) TaxID=797303 RepID=L0JMU9_NATP1|nr:HalOD1 output domain-containing protein [Natrinema pellirubrum]AGB32594.1 hypothetical protein Natpe_2792 [Natrinema pellirubrum DSM 15624]ELY73730.1 hypothetical protein C488_13048 [Natrinema pellirubrum DSM 15624]